MTTTSPWPCPVHNPENLTPEQFGEGYRPLTEDEFKAGAHRESVEYYYGGGFLPKALPESPYYPGSTYRVSLAKYPWPVEKADVLTDLQAIECWNVFWESLSQPLTGITTTNGVKGIKAAVRRALELAPQPFEIATLFAERDAAVKRAEEAERELAAIKSLAGSEELVRYDQLPDNKTNCVETVNHLHRRALAAKTAELRGQIEVVETGRALAERKLIESEAEIARLRAASDKPAPEIAPPISSNPLNEVGDMLRSDLETAWAWHCNIAMACFDCGARPHSACNKGAARFLSLLFPGVDTTKHPAYEGTPATLPAPRVPTVEELVKVYEAGYTAKPMGEVGSHLAGIAAVRDSVLAAYPFPKPVTWEDIEAVNKAIREGGMDWMVQEPSPRKPVSEPPEEQVNGLTWKELAIQLAEVWWWCSNNNANLQHGAFDSPHLTFSLVTLGEHGRCFHAPTPEQALEKAQAWTPPLPTAQASEGPVAPSVEPYRGQFASIDPTPPVETWEPPDLTQEERFTAFIEKCCADYKELTGKEYPLGRVTMPARKEGAQ